MFVSVGTCVLWCTCESQRETFWSLLSLSTLVWRPGPLASAVLHGASDSGWLVLMFLDNSPVSTSHLQGLSQGFQACVVSAFTHRAILMAKIT